MSEHTPGPWYFDGVFVTDGPESAPFSHNICQVRGDWSRPEVQGNGHLIAAAPDLLEALREMASLGPHAPVRKHGKAQARAIAAIDKAEGRQP